MALKHLYLKNVILGPRQISGTDTDTDIKNDLIKLYLILWYFDVFFSDNVFFLLLVIFSFTRSVIFFKENERKFVNKCLAYPDIYESAPQPGQSCAPEEV